MTCWNWTRGTELLGGVGLRQSTRSDGVGPPAAAGLMLSWPSLSLRWTSPCTLGGPAALVSTRTHAIGIRHRFVPWHDRGLHDRIGSISADKAMRRAARAAGLKVPELKSDDYDFELQKHFDAEK